MAGFLGLEFRFFERLRFLRGQFFPRFKVRFHFLDDVLLMFLTYICVNKSKSVEGISVERKSAMQNNKHFC